MSEFLDAVPVVGWGDDPRWRSVRRAGLGASEVSAALGLTRWRSPWQLWADKTGAYPDPFNGNAATELGQWLEGPLIDRACDLLQTPVAPPADRLYRHHAHAWRLASPDAVTMRSPRELIEIKTAGLLSPYALDGWTTDTVPLTYEIQCRWQMHVTGADVVHLVGLVPGFGVSVWDIDRDEDTEQQLVAAVDDWWHTHVVAGKEPPFSPSDSDVMNGRWSQTTPDAVALDATDIVPILEARREAAAQERAAAERKRELDAAIKALLGDHEAGMYAGDVVVTWGWESGRVSTQKAAAAGIDLEPFRGKPHRVLRIKEVA